MENHKSHKIHLSPLTIKDAEATYNLFSLPEVADFYDNKPIEHNESPMVFTYRIIKGSDYIWKISFKDKPNKLIGVCALHKWDAANKTIEIGGTLLPQLWNRNIMGTTFKEIIEVAKTKIGASHILARTSPTNIQAIQLVKKLGFKQTSLSVNEILLKLDLKTEQSIIQSTVYHLEKGNTILYPTDTVWGLGCNALNVRAISKINKIKNRPADKSYILLMKDLESIAQYADFNFNIIHEILSKTQKPTTIIYPLKNNVLKHVASINQTIAIRIPVGGFAEKLVNQIEFPLISTSANVSNTFTPDNYANIADSIKQKADYTVPKILLEKKAVKQQPSAIIKVDKFGNMNVIRE